MEIPMFYSSSRCLQRLVSALALFFAFASLTVAVFTSAHASSVPRSTAAVGTAIQPSDVNASSLLTETNAIFLPTISRQEPIACTAQPVLLEPADGAMLNTLLPLFRWVSPTETAVTRVRLEISTSAVFDTIDSSVIARPSSTDWWFPFDLQSDTQYYWRMQAWCGDVRGPYTSARAFRTGSGGTGPASPQRTAPANGTTTETTLTFRWQAVDGATGYVVYYRPVGQNGYSYVRLTVTQWTDTLTPGTTYEWWVRARNDYSLSEITEHWQFTVQAGNDRAAGNAHDGVLESVNGVEHFVTP